MEGNCAILFSNNSYCFPSDFAALLTRYLHSLPSLYTSPSTYLFLPSVVFSFSGYPFPVARIDISGRKAALLFAPRE